MSDVEYSLRAWALSIKTLSTTDAEKLCVDGANEIDRLRNDVETIAANRNYWRRAYEKRCVMVDFLYEKLEAKDEEIDRLRARIAELEAGLAEANGNVELFERKYNEWQDCAESLNSQLAEAKRNRITEEQIDAAWEYRGIDAREAVDDALEDLGILACEECGGFGYLPFSYGAGRDTVQCPACHRNGKSHGWVWKETTDV